MRAILVVIAAVALTVACTSDTDEQASGQFTAELAASPTATATPTATPAPGTATAAAVVPVEDVATWAALFCFVVEEFSDALDAVDSLAGGIDPTSLTVDDRKARAAKTLPILIDAYRSTAASLSPAATLRETSEYTLAWISSLEQLADAWEAEAERIAGASTALEIEASNARLGIVMQATDEEVSAAFTGLAPAAVAALLGVTGCASGLAR